MRVLALVRRGHGHELVANTWTDRAMMMCCSGGLSAPVDNLVSDTSIRVVRQIVLLLHPDHLAQRAPLSDLDRLVGLHRKVLRYGGRIF